MIRRVLGLVGLALLVFVIVCSTVGGCQAQGGFQLGPNIYTFGGSVQKTPIPAQGVTFASD